MSKGGGSEEGVRKGQGVRGGVAGEASGRPYLQRVGEGREEGGG